MAPTTTISYTGGLFPLQTVSEDEDGRQLERDVYNGYDQGESFSVPAGETAEVSEETAQRLVDDYPGCFTIGEPSPDKNDPRAELLAHTRAELDATAAEFGVEEPDKLANKDAVVDAILAKVAARDAG